MRMLAFLTVLMLLTGLPARAQNNDSDAGFIARLLQDSLSDAGRDVQIRGFRGALSARATIDELTIADDDGVWLILRDAAMQWNRAALLARRLEIGELSARELVLLRRPRADDAGLPPPEARDTPIRPFALPELPVSVQIGRLALDRIALGADVLGFDAALSASGTMALEGGAGSAALRVARIDGADGTFDLSAAYSNLSRVLSLDLSLTEGPDGIAAALLGIPNRPAASLSIRGAGPIDAFDASISLGTDGQDRVSGKVTVTGDGVTVAQVFVLDLAGDLRPLLVADFHPFFGAESRLRTAAQRLPDGRMQLDDLTVQTSLLDLRGRAALDGAGIPEVIDLSGRVADASGAPVVLPIGGPRTTVARIDLSLAFDAAQSQDWELEFDIRALLREDISIDRLLASGIGRIAQAPDGALRVVDALVDFDAEGIAPADPDLARAIGDSITGSTGIIWRAGEPLFVPGLSLEGADYWLEGKAQLENGDWRLDMEAELAQIARFSGLAGRALSGALGGRVAGTISPLTGGFDLQAVLSGQDVRVDITELDNLLAGTSEIRLDALRDPTGITLRQLGATAQTLRADLTGVIRSDDAQIDGAVEFADLSVLGADYGGALSAEVGLRTENGTERLQMTATARDLAVGQPQLDRALRGVTQLRVNALHDNGLISLALLDIANPALAATTRGVIARGASDLTAEFRLPALGAIVSGTGGSLEGSARLREDGPTRHLELDLTGQSLRAGVAQLDALLAGTTRLTARGSETGGAVFVNAASLSNPQLTGSVRGHAIGAMRQMELGAQLRNLGVIVPGAVGEARLGGTLRETDTGYLLDLTAFGPAGLSVTLRGDISRSLRADLTATGQMDLAFINPQIAPSSIQGPARFNLRVNGAPGPGAVSGTVTAEGVSFVQPGAHLRLTDIAGRAEVRGGAAQIDLRGQGARGGSFRASGVADLAGAAPRMDLRVALDALGVEDPQLFRTTVSGDFGFSGALNGAPLAAGTLTLGPTEIRVLGTGVSSIGHVPAGLRHLEEPADVRATRHRAGIRTRQGPGLRARPPMRLDLTLDAPNRVFVRGRGLDAELGGTLRLTGTTADVIPIGEFALIRGRLDLLTNRFTLTEGFASLQGEFNPFIRLVATTLGGDFTTSVIVDGQASAPAVRFESVPELPEEEALSRLIFGRDLTALSPFQAAQLASAVATLTGRGTNGFMDRLRGAMGLDDLDITTDAGGNAALRAGRYLNERIYTDVLVDPTGRTEVTINLDLSPSLSVRGRADATGRTAVGLFFERDY